MTGTYDDAFYAWQSGASRRSAARILGLLHARIPFRSVLDLGCGVGTWLAAAQALGAERVVGCDGAWVPRARLPAGVEFRPSELEQSAPVHGERFDLALSVEVAEHLSASRADSFVADLCAASDIVLFGAAIPGQGGEHHVHEAWQSSWAQRFHARGYACYDLIRPSLWHESSVEIWYRQNAFVYVADAARAAFADVDAVAPERFGMLDTVHPELWERRTPAYVAAHLGPRQRLRAALGIPRAIVQKVRSKHKSAGPS